MCRCWFTSFFLLVGLFAVGCGSVKAKDPDAGVQEDAAVDAGPGCTANAFSCVEDALFQCDEAGTQTSKVQDCQYGCANDKCNECDANTTFCSGDDLAHCSASGSLETPTACQHGCQMDRCNTCTPNVKYCNGNDAVTCGANGEPGATTNCASGCLSGVCNSCQPNTTTCDGDTLVVCNAGGTVQSATSCALGCSSTGTAHCKVMQPSYGVGRPSGTLTDLNVTASGTIDISNCANGLSVIVNIGGNMNAVPTSQVSNISQAGVAPICVVRFNKITIDSGFNLGVINSASPGHVLSLQAVSDIEISGRITFVNQAPGPSPGGDATTYGTNANNKTRAPGAGGGGAKYAGTDGGAYDPDSGSVDIVGGSGGPAVTTITTILTGGSRGGSVGNGTGGKGGGGLQLVSLTKVSLAATAVIDLTGKGGTGKGGVVEGMADLPAGGGGSGGTLVVEAPTVNVSAGAIAAANGGGGSGGCYACSGGVGGSCGHKFGENGQLSSNTARGGSCVIFVPELGNGSDENALGNQPSGAPSNQGATMYSGGGGGGSRGFIILRGKAAGSVTVSGSAIVSPMPSIEAVTAN